SRVPDRRERARVWRVPELRIGKGDLQQPLGDGFFFLLRVGFRPLFLRWLRRLRRNVGVRVGATAPLGGLALDLFPAVVEETHWFSSRRAIASAMGSSSGRSASRR